MGQGQRSINSMWFGRTEPPECHTFQRVNRRGQPREAAPESRKGVLRGTLVPSAESCHKGSASHTNRSRPNCAGGDGFRQDIQGNVDPKKTTHMRGLKQTYKKCRRVPLEFAILEPLQRLQP